MESYIANNLFQINSINWKHKINMMFNLSKSDKEKRIISKLYQINNRKLKHKINNLWPMLYMYNMENHSVYS